MTPEQVEALSDPELDTLMALAMGWEKSEMLIQVAINSILPTTCWTIPEDESTLVTNYHPTSNTTEGKAQCFELMVKFNISPLTDEKTVAYNYTNGMQNQHQGFVEYEGDDLQRAICESVALSIK